VLLAVCGGGVSWGQPNGPAGYSLPSGQYLQHTPQYIPPSPASPPGGGPATQEDNTAALLNDARELMKQSQTARAAERLRDLADALPRTLPAANEARFLQAECLRLLKRYPEAAKAYVRMLDDFPCGDFRKEAIEKVYGIANYWLDDTRQAIQQRQQQAREAIEKVSNIANFRRDTPEEIMRRQQAALQPMVGWMQQLSWDRSKPLWGQEEQALGLLEVVHYHDPVGPGADKALFLLGSVRLFREDYAEADRCFSLLVEHYPDSPLAPLAIIRALVCKRRGLETGAGRDTRLDQFRKQVRQARLNYPALDEEDREFLDLQLGWLQWQEWKPLLPGWAAAACQPLVDQALPEFPEGSSYEETFLTQRGPSWPGSGWLGQVPGAVAASCRPVQAAVDLLAGCWRTLPGWED
jgi:tetratricopeptide (TPR) repeat protein